MHPTTTLSEQALCQLFLEARTHHHWLPKPVEPQLLRQIYELARWGPTCVNCVPLRVLFIQSAEAREKLLPCLSGSNVRQVQEAPVTAVVAYDQQFYDHLARLFPSWDARPKYVADPALSEKTAFRNGSLQGGYFILAARALGLDAGPMSGFDNAKVDETFFADSSWRSNFLCNLGYGRAEELEPRGARLEFEEACRVI